MISVPPPPARRSLTLKERQARVRFIREALRQGFTWDRLSELLCMRPSSAKSWYKENRSALADCTAEGA